MKEKQHRKQILLRVHALFPDGRIIIREKYVVYMNYDTRL